MMDVIYIAGPYSGPDSWAREENIRVAEGLALELITEGLAPICVHATARFWYGRVSEAAAIAADMALLRRSDAVLLCPLWQRSRGTGMEIREAVELKIPIYETIEDLKMRTPMTTIRHDRGVIQL